MPKVLSQKEIDALINNVSSGEEVKTSNTKEDKKITLYNFKRPSLISKDQLRLLENIHENLARNFGVFLSAQLRMIVDMNLLAIDQIMYSEFVMSIAPPGAIYVGNIDEPYSQFILEMSPQLSIFIVEKLFGGEGDFITTKRAISVIEQRIIKRVVDKVGSEISKNWNPIKDFKCSFDRFESNPEFVQIIPTSEPVVVITMEIKLQNHTTLMNICYPYMWISNILSSPKSQEKVLFGNNEASSEEQIKIKHNLNNTSVKLRAVLGKSQFSIGDFLNLDKGDVVRLDSKVNSIIPLYVHNRHIYDAAIGQKEKNYACQINKVYKGFDND